MNAGKQYGVAVVGLGRFGSKRIQAIMHDSRARLRVVTDVETERARDVSAEMGCAYTMTWQQAVTRDDVAIVIVSTSTQFLSSIALGALLAGKHVLCEKPFGRTADEVLPLVMAAKDNKLSLKVGYNHRYHPALKRAHELFRGGAVGRTHYLHCMYGHGGRLGYEHEWRTKPECAGGGQLLDQGVHALDLFRWFGGEFCEVKAISATSFWPIVPLEDNVFALLRNQDGCVAQLHASWTSWKNTFQFLVSGEEGYLSISGLGGHYGTEKLIHGVRGVPGSAPQEHTFEYPAPDRSLQDEWEDFLDCIEQEREPQSSGEDSWKTLKLAEAIYASGREASQAVDTQSFAIPA